MDGLILLLGQLGYWTWFILAAILIAVEVMAPGAVFLWLAISAGIVGGIVFLEPDLDWKYQLAAFAVFSVVSIVASRRYMRSNPTPSEHPTLNRRGEAHVGREFVLDDGIRNGQGRVAIGDGTWRVAGPDVPAGSRVRVTATEGATLHVEPIE